MVVGTATATTAGFWHCLERIVDSSGNTQSMSPLFKMIVPHAGQVVALGPIFTPRNISMTTNQNWNWKLLLMPMTKLLFVVEFSPPPTA